MIFSPFGFRNKEVIITPSPLPSGLTVNLWQGDYVSGSTSWTNSAPGSTAVVSGMPSSGYTKNATGLVLSNTSGGLFSINSDGVWDDSVAYTIICYMHITSTNNTTFWSKQSASSNGMGVLVSNEPFIILRAYNNTREIKSSTVARGSLTSYGFTSTGNTNGQYYVDGSPVTTTVNTTATNFWNNGFNFRFGIANSWTDGPIQGYLNRLLIFNRELTSTEMTDVYNYVNTNQ